MNSKTHLNRFCGQYHYHQLSVYKKETSSLYHNWLNIPKQKQKRYYKLYFKLIKRQFKRLNVKSMRNLRWVLPNEEFLLSDIQELHSKSYEINSIVDEDVDENKKCFLPDGSKLKSTVIMPFSSNLSLVSDLDYFKDLIGSYKGQRLKGYNSYEEKILDNERSNEVKLKLDVYATYKELKTQLLY